MKLLLDENLPPSIVPALVSVFPGTVHVSNVGLLGSADSEIWNFALEYEYCIVSRDADFYERARLLRPAPRLIYVRSGNCSSERLIQLLARLSILDTFADPEAPRPCPGWEDTITADSPLRAAQRVPVPVDADLVAWFRSRGAGYQTRINAALRAWVEAHTTDDSR